MARGLSPGALQVKLNADIERFPPPESPIPDAGRAGGVAAAFGKSSATPSTPAIRCGTGRRESEAAR